MRIGRVEITHGYFVDLDNDEMVYFAKEALFDDITMAYKSNELSSYIKVSEKPEADSSEIPQFLLDNIQRDQERDA